MWWEKSSTMWDLVLGFQKFTPVCICLVCAQIWKIGGVHYPNISINKTCCGAEHGKLHQIWMAWTNLFTVPRNLSVLWGFPLVSPRSDLHLSAHTNSRPQPGGEARRESSCHRVLLQPKFTWTLEKTGGLMQDCVEVIVMHMASLRVKALCGVDIAVCIGCHGRQLGESVFFHCSLYIYMVYMKPQYDNRAVEGGNFSNFSNSKCFKLLPYLPNHIHICLHNVYNKCNIFSLIQTLCIVIYVCFFIVSFYVSFIVFNGPWVCNKVYYYWCWRRSRLSTGKRQDTS